MNQMDSPFNYGLIEHKEMINYLTNHNKKMQEQIQMLQTNIYRNNIFMQNFMNGSSSIIYDNNKEKGINIKFNTTRGLFTLIYARENIPLKTLLSIYMTRINKENLLFDKNIIFICNAKVLDKNDTREISHPDINIHDGSRIVVNDILCEI